MRLPPQAAPVVRGRAVIRSRPPCQVIDGECLTARQLAEYGSRVLANFELPATMQALAICRVNFGQGRPYCTEVSMRLLTLISLVLLGSLLATSAASAADRHPLKKLRAKVLAPACRSCR